MKARLNITIEASLLDKIKRYAAKKHISVSDLTEAYYAKLLQKGAEPESIFDFLEKVKTGRYPQNFDFKKIYRQRSEEKYGK